MTTLKQMTTALLTEHFRYTPLTLLDDIINTVNELVFRAINAIESGFANSAPEHLGFRLPPEQADSLPTDEDRLDALNELKQKEIDNGIVQLETLLNSVVDKDFDKFEIYTLRNILSVGHEEDDLVRWMRLEHYKDLDVEQKESSIKPEELLLERKKVHETAKLNIMLKAEQAKNAAVLEQLRGLMGVGGGDEAKQPAAFGFLMDSSSKSAPSQASQDSMRDVVSQLPALREMIDHLKASLSTLPSAQNARPEESSAATSRREYLDSQSRRALERRGVDTHSAGNVDLGTGRRVGKEEVEGLEAVVQALGGAGRDDDDMMEE